MPQNPVDDLLDYILEVCVLEIHQVPTLTFDRIHQQNLQLPAMTISTRYAVMVCTFRAQNLFVALTVT